LLSGGANATIWRDGRWLGEWPAVRKSLALSAIESCRGFLVVVGDTRSALWRRWGAVQWRLAGGEDEQCRSFFFSIRIVGCFF